MSITDEIEKNYQHCFKRIWIKRRLKVPAGSDYYEPDWLDITDYVLSVSNITWNIDDVELNKFTQGGFSITCLNDTFKFADENTSVSLFSGFLSRHKTKVKIEAGYIDENNVEYAYTIGAGFIVGDDIVAQSDGTIYIPCISPATIFDEASAGNINEGTLGGGGVDWYDTRAISYVVQKLYDMQIDSLYAFHPFLEGIVNTPANDIVADLYDFTDWKCSEALTKMAEISNSCYFIDGNFQLNFISKDGGAVSRFTFNGLGNSNINLFKISDYNEGIKNVYNRIEWYQTDPPVYAQNTWVSGDGSSIDKYGVRTYSVNNSLVTTGATRQTICDNLLGTYENAKAEVTIESKFVPQLWLLDRITVSYYGDYSNTTPAFWGTSSWGVGRWTGRIGGININKDMKIITIEHDVMNFATTLRLREI